ncbi:MAG TPA: 2-C-methyl-D-erythritol 2,4-cyclodiphosphate synthase, partial [Candidatus Acidoferrales bacterium]|nr:2-C-methyl-D-erythritol 2,4-cyclodiphosphate synthase [Candidatus Acidoferrales bacterium]
MFERYAERARRVISFAREEASQDGDRHIRSAHLLRGMAREAPELLNEAGLTGKQVQTIQEALKEGTGERFSTAVEVPLDEAAKRSLELATEAAGRWQSKTVEVVHILWGIYQADARLKEKLLAAGLTEEKLANLCQKYTVSEVKEYWSELVLPRSSSRSGIGYDLHRLAKGRKLILGGVEVPFDKGPLGHSDGDVVSHAISDALLGAASLGDIGTHFPDTDPQWGGVSSLVFLEH